MGQPPDSQRWSREDFPCVTRSRSKPSRENQLYKGRVGQPRSSQRYFQRTFPERPAQEQKPTREKSPQQGRAPSRNKITHRRSCTSRTSSWHVLPQRGRRVADRLVQRIWCRIRRSCVCRFRVTFAATNYASALTSSNNSCHSPDSLALHLGFAPGFRIVTFPPHLLCNSPRLNDLASRSYEYLISKRFLVTTAPIRATIPHEIGAPTRFARRLRMPLSAVPFRFPSLRPLLQVRGSAPLCCRGVSCGVSPRHPPPTTHHPLSSNYL